MKTIALIMALLLFNISTFGASSSFFNKKVILNLNNTDINSFFMLIARQSGLSLKVEDGIDGLLSYNFGKITPNSAMNRVASDVGIKFKVANNTLSISKDSFNDDSDSTTSATAGKIGYQLGNFNSIELKYLNANDIGPKVQGLLSSNEKMIIDAVSNTLTIFGSKKTTNRIKAYINSVDKAPTQILIEAQIVEMTKNKSQELGIDFGVLTNPSLSLNGTNKTGLTNTGFTTDPTVGLAVKVGQIASNILQLKLRAAESNGDAEIISKPKIVTLNNVTANISSGLTYNVKTLSSTSSGDGTATGSVQEISAGLNLSVTPTKVGNSEVMLKIDVNNSEPDKANGVDGIPGINENSAKTTIIVNNGQTATMAGLIKSNIGSKESGVPILKDLPFLGWLFKSKADSDIKKELLIFITPTILKKGEVIVSKMTLNKKKKENK